MTTCPAKCIPAGADPISVTFPLTHVGPSSTVVAGGRKYCELDAVMQHASTSVLEVSGEGCVDTLLQCLAGHCKEKAWCTQSSVAGFPSANLTPARCGSSGSRGCPSVSDQAMPLLAPCTKLVHLNISGYPGIGDGGVRALAAACHQIQRLVAFGNNSITDAGITVLATSCQLKCRYLNECKGLTDQGIISLAKASPQLCDVHLSQNNQLTHHAVAAFASCAFAACTQLEVLYPLWLQLQPFLGSGPGCLHPAAYIAPG
eukprot:gene3050-3600_t